MDDVRWSDLSTYGGGVGFGILLAEVPRLLPYSWGAVAYGGVHNPGDVYVPLQPNSSAWSEYKGVMKKPIFIADILS